jgi:hypothetical protein
LTVWVNEDIDQVDMEFSSSRFVIAAVLACLVMGGAAAHQMRRGRPVDEAKYFLLKLAVVV